MAGRDFKGFVRKPSVWGGVAAALLVAAGTAWYLRRRSTQKQESSPEDYPEGGELIG